ncbi:MAG TPA: hypothetical protein VFP35_02555 [Candidatus Saccharimonadales bacterium]|nr:hypothetical protein [Candidatus Saccharimonadales bacterium]
MTAENPSPPGKDTIYVDVDDEITSIIDKVEGAKAKIVALVLPKRASALQSIVNMRLLKRSADNADKNVVLITSEAAILPLAGAAGLHVAKDLQSRPEVPPSPVSQPVTPKSAPEAAIASPADEDEDIDDKNATLDYHRSIGELAAAHAVDEDEAIALTDEDSGLPEPKEPKSSAGIQAKSQKIRVPNFERFRLMMAGGILLVLAIIIFIILAIWVLPKATITIHTASSPISANLTLDASDKYKTLNESAGQIPASLKAVNQTANEQVPATGQQNNGQPASGSITMFTEDCSGKLPAEVPAGTGASSDGLTFITQSTASFSPTTDSGGNCYYTSGSVNVKSQQGGSKYNLDSGSTFSISGYPGLTGKNSKDFSGGTDSITTVVSQADLDSAKQKATSGNNTTNFTNQFKQQLASQGYYVLNSTLKANDPKVTATPDVGQPASNVNVTVTTTYTVLVISKSDLNKVITDNLNSQINLSKQKISTADVVKKASVNVQNQNGQADATLIVSEDSTAVPIINTAQVKQISAGQKTGDIKSAISGWPGVNQVDVKLSPFWVSKAPKSPGKIKVILEQKAG